MTPLDHMRARAIAFYVLDPQGRILGVNQWDGGLAARFHLFTTESGAHAIVGAALPDDVARELLALAASEPPRDPRALPAYDERYRALIESHAPVQRVRAGPAFVCDSRPDMPGNVAEITQDNADLLRGGGLAPWIPDIPHRRPFFAALENGRAAAVCVSARISKPAHEAGVETDPFWRRRGCALRAVAAWTRAVQDLNGPTPYYSTTWDNIASQAIAARLGFTFIGTDYNIA